MNLRSRAVRTTVVCVLASMVVLFAIGSLVGAARETPRLERVWAASALEEPEAIAADTGGVVVGGHSGDLVALDPSGAKTWSTTFRPSSVVGPLALGDGVAIAVVGSERRVVALDRSTGSPSWERMDGGAEAVGIGDGSVAVLSTSGRLGVVDVGNGRERWHVETGTGERISMSVWIARGRVVAAWSDDQGSHVTGYDAATGALVWRHDARHYGSGPTLSGSAITFAANVRKARGSIVARVMSLAAVDGSELWTREIRGKFPYLSTIATAARSHDVAVVDFDGRVTMLDARSGRVRWRRATDRRQLEARPMLVGGAYVLPTYGTGLTALGVARGSTVENDEPGAVQTAVTIEATAVAGDRLYLLVRYGSGEGGVWMLRPGRG